MTRLKFYRKSNRHQPLPFLFFAIFIIIFNLTLFGQLSFDKAKLERLTKEIDKSPNKAQLYYERGHFYDVEVNDDEKAIEDFTKAINLSPQNPLYIVRRAHLLAGSDQFEIISGPPNLSLNILIITNIWQSALLT
jgi:tetratricopeptide (TPR) repeat protein